ncbi:MAG: ArsR/SmtB family transcription factor [Candidatus Eremiobacter antarcticus]
MKRASVLTVRTLGQVRALADPLRAQMFAAFAHGPRTTKHVADALGASPTKLYRHLAILERAGLVRRAHTKRKRGTVEQYFVAAARRLAVDPTLFQGAERDETLARFRMSIGKWMDAAANEMLQTVQHRARCRDRGSRLKMVVSRFATRIPETRLPKVTKQLEEWMVDARQSSRKGVAYGCFLCFYPLQPDRDDGD